VTIERDGKGHFAKGRSPNPGGRPKSEASMLALARRYSKLAIMTLKQIAEDPKSPVASRVSASTALLDRAWGKPGQLELPMQNPGARPMVMRVEFVRAINGKPAPADLPPLIDLPANVARLPLAETG
jgi:hypothetical protein